MKAQMVLVAAFALLGCAGSDYRAHDFAPDRGAAVGAREAAQLQELPGCPARHRQSYKLADADGEHLLAFKAGARYAQLDDPTKDWTRERQTGQSSRCPPTGRQHRYFA